MFEMNPWWEENFELKGILRKKYLEVLEKNLKNKDIIFITGLRRVGKSTLLKQLIFKLINETKIKRILNEANELCTH